MSDNTGKLRSGLDESHIHYPEEASSALEAHFEGLLDPQEPREQPESTAFSLFFRFSPRF